jgi:hypothetical protein
MPRTTTYKLLLLCSYFAFCKQTFAFSGLNMMVNSIFPERATSLLRSGQTSTFLSDTSSNILYPLSKITMSASFWSKLFTDESSAKNLDLPVKNLDDWKELKDPSSGKPYFWNKGTGSTTWQRPDSITEIINEKDVIRPLVAPSPKQFTFSNSPRTFVVGGCSAAGKSGGRLKENQDAIIIKVGHSTPPSPCC